MLPAGSMATIAKMCRPLASGPSRWGDEQGSIAPESSRQRKVTLGSLAANLNRGLGLVAATPGVGPAEILTLGATVSTVNDREAGALTLPAASTALTEKPCGPFASGTWGVNGEPQENQSGWALRRHWKVVPTWFELNLNVGLASRMCPPWLGPDEMLAFGGILAAEKLA